MSAQALCHLGTKFCQGRDLLLFRSLCGTINIQHFRDGAFTKSVALANAIGLGFRDFQLDKPGDACVRGKIVKIRFNLQQNMYSTNSIDNNYQTNK